MTLEEVIAEKVRCEECIQAVIQRFVEKTGLSVYGVKQESITFTEFNGDEKVSLTLVKLDVRL